MKYTRAIDPLYRWSACLTALLMLGLTVQAAGVPGIITKRDKTQLKGIIRWQPASKVYVVKKARSNVELKVSLRDVVRVSVRKPSKIDAAVKMVKRKQYAAAIPALEQIMKDYAMLEWDVSAARWLAECYLKTKRAKDAVKMCEKVIKKNPNAASSGDLASVYWDALIETEQFLKLRKALDIAVQKGNRQVAAVAQVKRGDIDMKKGEFKNALIGGYLRTIVFFGQLKFIQPEALYKAAKCFEKLGQHSHAEKMKKKLMTEYPRDPYTDQVRIGT